MKKNIFKKLGGLFLGLAMGLGVAVGVTAGNKASEVKAANYTATLSPSKVTKAGNLTDDKNKTWAFSYVSTVAPTSETGGIHVGTNKGNATSITVKSTAFNDYLITKISVYAAAKANTNAKTHISIGGTEVAVSSAVLENTFSSGGTELSFDNSTAQKTGEIDVTVSRPSSNTGALYLNKVVVEYQEKAEDVDLTDISLQSTAEVILGESVELAPIKTPANANNKTTLTWESLNPTVATVSNGKVTGVTVGTAQIRVNATDIGKSAVCTVTVNPVPPVVVTHTIADCYSVSTGTNVKFNGVYMGTYGNNPYQGIFFADGEYGIIIYKTSSVPESWEVGKTVVAVSGQTAFYNGLVQVTNASFETTSATVADPVPYTFLGTETTGNALSRKSSISGTVISVTGQTNNAFVTGTDGKVTVDLGGGKTAMIFIKKGVHTAKELAEYSEKFTVGAYVVVTGFLNYYNNTTTFKGTYTPGSFQIIVPTIVSTEVYDANAFAADFLSDTDAICSIVKEDHSTELQAAWADIGAKFTALNDTEKAKVSAAVAGEDNDLSKAVERYDYLVAKYGLTNFISERPASPSRSIDYVNYGNNSSTTIIIVVSVVSLTTLAALLVIKRRKAIEK